MIYLATPYSHPDPAVMQQRFEEAARCVAVHMARDSRVLFSPIVHNHPIAVMYGLPRGWEFWENWDKQTIERCDELWVVKMEGYDTSKGITAEVVIAKDLNIPVTYHNVDFFS